MILPTLGRIVWFTPEIGDPMPTEHDGRCAAIAVKVWSVRMVNLVVFDAEGKQHPIASVTMIQDGETPPATGRYCEWIP